MNTPEENLEAIKDDLYEIIQLFTNWSVEAYEDAPFEELDMEEDTMTAITVAVEDKFSIELEEDVITLRSSPSSTATLINSILYVS